MKYVAGALFLFTLVTGTLSLHEAAADPAVSLGRFSVLVSVYGLLFCLSGLILDLDTLARRQRIEDAEKDLLRDVRNIRDKAAHADRIVRNMEKRERNLV
jgi:hypothetical protein